MRSSIYFTLASLGIQTVATVLGLAALELLRPRLQLGITFEISLLLGVVLVLCATVGWLGAVFLYLPRPWRVFNALILPLVLLFLFTPLPAWVFGVLFLSALLLYLPTIWTRVPYYPTSKPIFEAVLNELPAKHCSFIDLGCGFSELLCYLAKRRPESSFEGIELSPLAYLVSLVKVRARGLRNVRIRYGSFWQVDLGEYTVVYAFLAPPPMRSLWEKAKREMKPETILLSNSFAVPDEPADIISVPRTHQGSIFRYRF
jgi:hypothetical protein